MFDEAHRAGDFRRKRDEDDAAAGGILAAIEVVDGRGLHVLSRMRAPGAILRRHVRSLHVNAGNGRTGHARQHARARRELLEARGDERRQAAGHAGAPHPLQRFAGSIGCQVGRVEIDAAEAVHLKIEQARQLDGHDSSLSRISPRLALASSAAESRSR